MIEVIKDNGIYMGHPDGGHCNLMGMTDDCYGCAMYGEGVSPNIVRVIPKSELVFGKVYEGECINADEAKWGDGKFVYERYKFGHRYEELINHFEDNDGYDVFVPMEIIGD